MHVFISDCVPLLTLAMSVGFICYKAYELRDTMVHGPFGIVGYLDMGTMGAMHDSGHVWYDFVLLLTDDFINFLVEMCRQFQAHLHILISYNKKAPE